MSKGMHSNSTLLGMQKGFTLIEVILVLVIVAVLSAVVLTRNNSTAAKAICKGQADLIKSQLRYAQARSLNANQVWGMRANGNDLILFNGGSTANPIIIPGETATPVVYGIGDRKNLTVGDFTVSFDDRGRPYSDEAATEAFRLAAAYTITISHGSSASETISITPNTGFIR